MGEIELPNLYNCTALLLDRLPFYNTSIIWSFNRSQLLEILAAILDENSITQNHKFFLREFLSDCLLPRQQKPTDLSWWLKAVWTSIFTAMLIVATGGNAIVMWIILGIVLKTILYITLGLSLGYSVLD